MFDELNASSNREMVEKQLVFRGINDSAVLQAFLDVDRAHFVPEAMRGHTYYDQALTIGHEQTISQPYMVAFMTEYLQLTGSEKVLEIGTGSGYQTAILSRLAAEVYTIERIPELGEKSRKLLENLGFDNIHYRIGNGFEGWPQEAPFNAIIITAAPEEIPETLAHQLALGGFMLVPVGERYHCQTLYRLKRRAGDFEINDLGPVAFVPMLED
jgi:protein-L-isoaspartate(D-aspartate) O-methyltransferase